MNSFVHIPLLQNPDAKKAMVMCFGAGNTLAATLLHASLEEVHMVDLSRHVMEQARHYEGGDASRTRACRSS